MAPKKSNVTRRDFLKGTVAGTGATVVLTGLGVEKAEAKAEALKGMKNRKPAGLDDEVRRRAVMTARARRRVPHVSLHYY